MKKIIQLLAVFAAMISLAGAQTTIQAKQAIQIELKGVPDGEAAQVTGNYTVSESGYVRLPMLDGQIRAAGLSSTTLAQNIEAAYKSAQIYVHPSIQVLASSDQKPLQLQYTVGGQVKSPGPREYYDGLTLYQALQAGGGATEFGSLKRVSLIRDGKETVYDVTQNQFKGIIIQPKDTIIVPQKRPFEF
jgi:polysaccharide biosynthesis/export protein VpsN